YICARVDPAPLTVLVFPYLFFFSFSCSALPRALHSFPTRRSSDLRGSPPPAGYPGRTHTSPRIRSNRRAEAPCSQKGIASVRPRSEEHTSELQSLAYLVCRLLLEKKNIKIDQGFQQYYSHALPSVN